MAFFVWVCLVQCTNHQRKVPAEPTGRLANVAARCCLEHAQSRDHFKEGPRQPKEIAREVSTWTLGQKSSITVIMSGSVEK